MTLGTPKSCEIPQQMKVTANRKFWARFKSLILPLTHVQILAFFFLQFTLNEISSASRMILMPELLSRCTNKTGGIRRKTEN